MSFLIEEINIPRNGIVLQNQSIWRPFSFRENWTRLRLGIAIHCKATSATFLVASPRFYFGICSDVGKGPMVAGCEHFVGYRTNAASFSYFSAAQGAIVYTATTSANAQLIKIENGIIDSQTFNVATSSSGQIIFGATHGDGRQFVTHQILEFSRVDSTTLQLDRISGTGTTTTTTVTNNVCGISDAAFLNGMESNAPLSTVASAFASHSSYVSTNEITIDESTYGPLDSFAIAWSRSANSMILCRAVVSSLEI